MSEISERDRSVIEHILMYCDQVIERITKYNMDHDKFFSVAEYRDMLSMPILQIGELTKHLSEEFIKTHSDIPWAQIRGMRNIFAHNYLNMNLDYIWNTAVDDIPGLRKFCEDII